MYKECINAKCTKEGKGLDRTAFLLSHNISFATYHNYFVNLVENLHFLNPPNDSRRIADAHSATEISTMCRRRNCTRISTDQTDTF